MKVAQFLENHPKVRRVHYPGLKSHPQHELALKQMRGYSGLMSFELWTEDRQEILDFLNRLEWFQFGCSWGGHESLPLPMTINASKEQLEREGVSNSVIRISVGHEGADALIADLENSLNQIKK